MLFGKIRKEIRTADILCCRSQGIGPRLARCIMNVLTLTVLFSSLLAVFFITAFVAEWRRGRRSSIERESLLPLEEGGRVVPPKPRKHPGSR